MDNNQLEAFQSVTIAVSIVVVIVAVVIWFIFIAQAGLEETRLKHETCMIETTTYAGTGNVVVVDFCGTEREDVNVSEK